MEDKPRVRPGLSSPHQSQDVEFTIDQQIDEGQHERMEKEGDGPLGPPNTDKRYKSNGKRSEIARRQDMPDLEKPPRTTPP